MTNTERAEILARMRRETDAWQRAHEMTIADANVTCDPKSDEHLDTHDECDYRITLKRNVAALLAD